MQNLSTLRRAIEDAPNNVRLWLLYGQTLVSRGDLPEARRAFENALELAPTDLEARLGIAQVIFREGRLSEAAVRTQSILQDDRTYAPGHLLMTRIYLAEHETMKAAEHYDAVRAISVSLTDCDLERELALQGHRPKTLDPLDEESDRPRLIANANWEGEEADSEFPDPLDYELAGIEGPMIEQEEFGFVDDDDLGFNIDEFERPKGCFAEVAGLDEVKDELLMKLVYPYQYGDLFSAYGKKAGGGVLLHGPPGCGKSLVCRALAGETQAGFYTLKLHQVLEMYIGCSEKNLNSLFQLARENTPSVIFIDELDALASHRGDLKQNAARTVVNQLLTELDGHDGANEGLLVIAATSAISSVDPAFLRPGRFDRRIYVPPPDLDSRKQILRFQARNRPVTELDFDDLASRMEDFSGADIVQVFDLAVEDVLRLAMRKKEIVPITTEVLQAAVERVEPSVPQWRKSEEPAP